MTAQYTYIPVRASLLDYNVVPARPNFYAPAALSFNRWSAYYGQPRTTLAPAKIGLAGLGAVVPKWMHTEHRGAFQRLRDIQRSSARLEQELRAHVGKENRYIESLKGLGGFGACCAPCGRGEPCSAGCSGTSGVSGLYASFQNSTGGYGMPVLVGAGIGYLTEKKTGAIVGGLLGAFFRWAWGQAEPTVMPIVEAVTPAGTAGFTDEFSWNPTMGEGDTTMDRAAFRTLQIIMLIGATTLALKVGKTAMRGMRKNPSRRRSSAKSEMRFLGGISNAEKAGYALGLTGAMPWAAIRDMSPAKQEAFLRGYARGEEESQQGGAKANPSRRRRNPDSAEYPFAVYAIRRGEPRVWEQSFASLDSAKRYAQQLRESFGEHFAIVRAPSREILWRTGQ